MAGHDVPRRAERVPLRADILFRRSGDARYAVDLVDLSPDGCRIDLPEVLTIGERVWIALPGLEPIQAEVRWVKEWTAGIQFLRPLYPAVFDHIRSRIPPA